MLFLAPPTGTQVSGGFLINRLIQDLFKDQLASMNADAADLGKMLADRGDGEAVLFDSLYLFDPAACRALEQTSTRLRLVLLAHSLPSLLPDRPITVRRADLTRERMLLPHLAGAIAPSRFMTDALGRRGLHHRAVIAEPPPICDGRLAGGVSEPTQQTTSAPGSIGAATLRVLTVANVTPAKGLLDAARALCGCGSLRWEWTIAGREPDSAYAGQIRRVLNDAGFTDRVRWAGVAGPQELHRFYREADLLLLPSRMESYGLAFSEAISHGVEVAGYRCAAVPETVGAAGRLVQPGDIAGLAAAVRETGAFREIAAVRETGVAQRRAVLPDARGYAESVLNALSAVATEAG